MLYVIPKKLCKKCDIPNIKTSVELFDGINYSTFKFFFFKLDYTGIQGHLIKQRHSKSLKPAFISPCYKDTMYLIEILWYLATRLSNPPFLAPSWRISCRYLCHGFCGPGRPFHSHPFLATWEAQSHEGLPWTPQG